MGLIIKLASIFYDKAGIKFFDGPRRREAAGWHGGVVPRNPEMSSALKLLGRLSTIRAVICHDFKVRHEERWPFSFRRDHTSKRPCVVREG